MLYHRVLDLQALLSHRSLFLFGPRQTGKTTYLHERYPDARFVDLLDARTFRELSVRPELLRLSLTPNVTLIVIDEIQKLPLLLDEVHLLIERNKSLRFILTGSSARKLHQKSTNLLAGRALTVRLHPLVSPEVEFRDLNKRLQLGGLPSVLTSPSPTKTSPRTSARTCKRKSTPKGWHAGSSRSPASWRSLHSRMANS
jgi:predicted AAA+ superfamily ATPase